MGGLQIMGLILLLFAWMLMAAANKQYREETGNAKPECHEVCAPERP